MIATLYDEMLTHHGLHDRPASTRASISAGRSTPRPQAPAYRDEYAESCARRVLPPAEDAGAMRARLLAEAYDAFGWRAAA